MTGITPESLSDEFYCLFGIAQSSPELSQKNQALLRSQEVIQEGLTHFPQVPEFKEMQEQLDDFRSTAQLTGP
jgi:hypothetical protein